LAQNATPVTADGRPELLTPISLSNGLTVLYYRFLPARYDGDWEVLGEFRNDSDNRIELPTIEFRFTDQHNNTYWQFATYTPNPWLDPGETGFFYAPMSSESITLIEDWTILEVHPCASSVYAESDLENVRYRLDASKLVLDYNGVLDGPVEISNDGTSLGESPELFVITRDDSGFVIWIDSDLIGTGPVEPGTFVRDSVSLFVPIPNSGYELYLTENTGGAISC